MVKRHIAENPANIKQAIKQRRNTYVSVGVDGIITYSSFLKTHAKGLAKQKTQLVTFFWCFLIIFASFAILTFLSYGILNRNLSSVTRRRIYIRLHLRIVVNYRLRKPTALLTPCSGRFRCGKKRRLEVFCLATSGSKRRFMPKYTDFRN